MWRPRSSRAFWYTHTSVISCTISSQRWFCVTLLCKPFQTCLMRLWTGLWQEVERDPAGSRRLQRQLDLQAIMDAAVVENEMAPAGLRVRLRHELVKKLQEQEAVSSIVLNQLEME